MGKIRNRQRDSGRNTKNRNYRQELGEKELYLSDKHLQQRQEFINKNPIVPMNAKQERYMKLIDEKSCVLAMGYAGSSKSFIPSAMFADLYRVGKLDKIYLIRPAVSNSKSLGFFAGSVEAKASIWLAPILQTLYQRLGKASTLLAIENGDIEFVPMEVVKGRSFGGKHETVGVIVTEAEDCDVSEIVSLTTRLGENCKMVIEGDCMFQSALGKNNGLSKAVEIVQGNKNLQEYVGLINFDEISDIVRSKECREWIKAYSKAGLM